MGAAQIIASYGHTRAALGLGVLFALWWIEAWIPFWHERGERPPRLRHAGRNLAISLLNVGLVAALFSSATAFTANWAESSGFGVLRWALLPTGTSTPAAILLMDGWMYVWHRLNHAVPALWRFHRMHHTDPSMDVTTATRFRPVEIVISSVLRLGVIALLGMSVW